MLRTNLSTRPFYNERVVQIVLAAAAVLVVAVALYNAAQFRSLSARYEQLLGRVGDEERRAAGLRTDAERARRSVDRAQLETVAAAAREANGLIDQRTFSWTELLNRLESTLPGDVRVQTIRPSTDREGRLSISMIVLGHRAEDIQQFVEQLQAKGGFEHVYTTSETTNPQGLLEVVLQGRYRATPPQAPAPVAKGRED
jgi:Tfp pilus assembly protein PilN